MLPGIHTHLQTYALTNTHLHTHTHLQTHALTNTQIHTCTHTYTLTPQMHKQTCAYTHDNCQARIIMIKVHREIEIP